jgi:Na+-transporting NADH:ubiquinone oxidoreductase subunit NqrC
LVVAKFNDLSKTTQVLLTLLGFGLGSVIYDYYHRSKFANYDDKTRTYKIDTDKY